MKYLLGIDLDKYHRAIDTKKVAQEKERYEKLKVDMVTYKFLYRIENIMKGGK